MISAKYYYGEDQPNSDHRTLITLSIKLLESPQLFPFGNRSAALDSRTSTFAEKFTSAVLPDRKCLAAIILTVTDIFCDMIDNDSHRSHWTSLTQ